MPKVKDSCLGWSEATNSLGSAVRGSGGPLCCDVDDFLPTNTHVFKAWAPTCDTVGR